MSDIKNFTDEELELELNKRRKEKEKTKSLEDQHQKELRDRFYQNKRLADNEILRLKQNSMDKAVGIAEKYGVPISWIDMNYTPRSAATIFANSDVLNELESDLGEWWVPSTY